MTSVLIPLQSSSSEPIMAAFLPSLLTRLLHAEDLPSAAGLVATHSDAIVESSWADVKSSGLVPTLLRLATTNASIVEAPSAAAILLHVDVLTFLCRHLPSITSDPDDLLQKGLPDLIRQSARILGISSVDRETSWAIESKQIRLLHGVLIQSRGDEAFVLSLPTELILTIIHDVYFPLSRHSTPEPDEFTALQSSSCVHRLLSERDIGELVADAFRRTVARVTLEATATRFIQLFSDKPQLSCAFAACHLDMMASACCLPALTRHLQSRGGHKVATRAIWRLLRTEPTQADDWALSGEALVRMLARMLVTLSAAPEGVVRSRGDLLACVATLGDLVREDDLILMLGKVLHVASMHAAYEGPTDGGQRLQLEPIFLTLQTLCHLDPLLETNVRTQWLHVLNGFSVLSRSPSPNSPSCQSHACLELWNTLGSKLGFDEKTARQDEMAQIRESTGRLLKGCSWFKCLLSDGEAEDTMLICCGCRVARYCKPVCQALDWKEGGHRGWCKAHSYLAGTQ